jgi:hypothetical protein
VSARGVDDSGCTFADDFLQAVPLDHRAIIPGAR